MKFIVLELLCLSCAVALADELQEPSEEVDEETESPDTEVTDHSQPWPIGFYYVEDPFILSITKKLNWFDATAACAYRGFTLASIGSYTKQRELYQTILQSGFQRQMNESVWTSGSNLADGATWRWYSTGKAFTYRNFQNQSVSTEYRCMAYNTTTGYWSDELCTDKRYFICECA